MIVLLLYWSTAFYLQALRAKLLPSFKIISFIDDVIPVGRRQAKRLYENQVESLPEFRDHISHDNSSNGASADGSISAVHADFSSFSVLIPPLRCAIRIPQPRQEYLMWHIRVQEVFLIQLEYTSISSYIWYYSVTAYGKQGFRSKH